MEAVQVLPKKRGRKPKKPKGVGKAIVATKTAIEEAKEIFSKMGDRNRALFVSLSSGEDELVALLKAGHRHGITTIAKVVYLKEDDPETGKPKALLTKHLSLENVCNLDAFSYERLLRIAKTEVKHIVGKTDYHDFVCDITGLFKLLAPEQLAVLASISGKPTAKDSDRIKAATAILDRANYKGPGGDGGKESPMPVQVNVVIGGIPKAEFNPIIDVTP